jgi:S1-C subfamily serine protease
MALIPPFFIDCVVAIGTVVEDQQYWIGTGFLFGNLIEETEDKFNKYNVYLVTNKHVLNNLNTIKVRFNPQMEQSAKDYDLILKDDNGNLLWTGHPDPEIDVAVVGINISKVRDEGMKCSFFESDRHVETIEQLKQRDTSEGDSIFVMGFPMGMVAIDRQHTFVRGGIISRIKDLFEKRSKDFVIDAFVFPGNSGGPVITRPETQSIHGTKFSTKANLIGIVKSYIPYNDVAISQQTKRPRVVFEENTGLTKIEPVDYILETIQNAIDHPPLLVVN